MPITILTAEYTNGAIILDAGSSGTRVLVYRWKSPRDASDPVARAHVPVGDAYYNFDRDVIIHQVLNHTWQRGSWPPLVHRMNTNSELAHNGPAETPLAAQTRGTVAGYLTALLQQAGINLQVGNVDRRCTLTIMSTGGMRDLRAANVASHNLLQAGIYEYLRSVPYRNPRYETISGKKEALYGWVAANYVLRHLPRPGLGIRPGLVGYMEMGGATVQIAYQPTLNELTRLNDGVKLYHGKFTQVLIWGQVINLFVKSFTLGSDTAWRKHNTAVLKLENGQRSDPCRPNNCPNLSNADAGVVGEYNQTMCEYLTYQLLRHAITPEAGYPTTAPPGQIPQTFARTPIGLLQLAPWNPTYGSNKDRQFVGGAHFYYTTRSTFGCDAWGHAKEEPYTFANLQPEVAAMGAKPWDQLVLDQKPEYAEKALFNAAWVTTVLYDGFGFDRNDPNVMFQPFNGPTRGPKDERPESVWALGAVVLDAIGRARPNDTLIRQFLPHKNESCPDTRLYDSVEKAGSWDETTDWFGMPVGG